VRPGILPLNLRGAGQVWHVANQGPGASRCRRRYEAIRRRAVRHLHSKGSSANHWVSTLTMRVIILTVW